MQILNITDHILQGKLYTAAYDFQAEDDSELSMRKGDVVRVTETSDPNWWSGRCPNQVVFSSYTYTQSSYPDSLNSQ